MDGLREEQDRLSEHRLQLKHRVKELHKAHKEQEVTSPPASSVLQHLSGSNGPTFCPAALFSGSEQTETVGAGTEAPSGEDSPGESQVSYLSLMT